MNKKTVLLTKYYNFFTLQTCNMANRCDYHNILFGSSHPLEQGLPVGLEQAKDLGVVGPVLDCEEIYD